MGVRMVCANCHDHPFERWTQNQYYELAAFFSAVGLKPGFANDEQIVYVKRDKSGVKYPQNGKYAEPQYLVATSGAPPIPDDVIGFQKCGWYLRNSNLSELNWQEPGCEYNQWKLPLNKTDPQSILCPLLRAANKALYICSK